jgi:hypothetical protein
MYMQRHSYWDLMANVIILHLINKKEILETSNSTGENEVSNTSLKKRKTN